MTTQKDILIIGAGMAGLSAAHHLKKSGADVQVLEKSPRAGGAVHSERFGDYLLELGPNTVKPTPSLMTLIDDLGLPDRMMLADASAPRFIWDGFRLHPVPMGPLPLLLSPLLSAGAKIRLLKEPWVKTAPMGEESLSSFIGRRFGPEVSEKLVKPFVSGIWAGDAETLSAEAAFPSLTSWEREAGSVLKGALRSRKQKNGSGKKVPRGLLSFPNGLEEVVLALKQNLGENLSLSQNDFSLEKNPDGTWTAGEWSAPIVLITAPAWASAALLEAIDPAVSSALKQIPYSFLAVAHFSADAGGLRPSPKGFGYLSLPKVSRGVLGCVFSSCLFPGRSAPKKDLLTVFLGGSLFQNLEEESDDKLHDLALTQLSGPFAWKTPPTVIKITRYPKGIPQYTRGHQKRVKEILKAEERHSGLYFAGNYIGGISVGDVVENAVKTAKRILGNA